MKPGMVVHTCNPSYWGGRRQEGSQFKVNPGKKMGGDVRLSFQLCGRYKWEDRITKCEILFKT
jgi:hypothetical protein